MGSRLHFAWLAIGIVSVTSLGCCTVNGPCGGCGVDGGGMVPLLACDSCAGGCGERYIDEWTSEPPCGDTCGAAVGCGCGGCQPVRNLLRCLWGSRYVGTCGSVCTDGACGSSSFGCPSCGESMHGTSGGCSHCAGAVGKTDSVPMGTISPTPLPAPTEVHGEHVPTPTPAPAVAPSSAKRLSPVQQRHTSKH